MREAQRSLLLSAKTDVEICPSFPPNAGPREHQELSACQRAVITTHPQQHVHAPRAPSYWSSFAALDERRRQVAMDTKDCFESETFLRRVRITFTTWSLAGANLKPDQRGSLCIYKALDSQNTTRAGTRCDVKLILHSLQFQSKRTSRMP